MILKLLAPLFIFLLPPGFSFAGTPSNTCQNQNLSGCFGANRSSGGAEWCWANAAADLMTCAEGIKPPERISTIDVAVTQLTIDGDEMEEIADSFNNERLNRWVFIDQMAKLRKDLMSQKLPAQLGSHASSAIMSYQKKSGYCLESDLPSIPLEGNYVHSFFNSIYQGIESRDILRTPANPDDPRAENTKQKINLAFSRTVLAKMENELDHD